MVIHMKDKALYIDRPMYVDKIMAYVDAPFIKILTGIRRCGKSTMLKIIMDRLHYQKNVPKERIVSFRFDSPPAQPTPCLTSSLCLFLLQDSI